MVKEYKHVSIQEEYATNNWLSNLYGIPLYINGMVFQSADKKLKSFVGQARWEQYRVWAMAQVLYTKFGGKENTEHSAYRNIRQALLDTGDAYLLEDDGNAKSFWGGTIVNDEICGENMTGKVLMLIRNWIKFPEETAAWDIFTSGADILLKKGDAIQGSGIALAFAKKPEFAAENKAFSAYLGDPQTRAMPGCVFKTDRVFYCITKWRPDPKEKIMISTVMELGKNIKVAAPEGKVLAIPRLGCGRANGNWLDIFPLLLTGLAGYRGNIIISGVKFY